MHKQNTISTVLKVDKNYYDKDNIKLRKRGMSGGKSGEGEEATESAKAESACLKCQLTWG